MRPLTESISLERCHRILLVVRWPIGGIRSYIRYVYRHLTPLRYHIIAVLPQSAEHEAFVEDLNDLSPTYITMPPNPRPLDFSRRLLRILRTERIDLVHSHGMTAGSCSALPAFLTRTPHILTVHETFDRCLFSGIQGHAMRMGLLALMNFPDVIHCVGADLRENLLGFLPALRRRRERIVTIPSGIDVERFMQPEKADLRKELDLPVSAFLVGYLGRFMPEKGFRYLVEAMGILVKGGPPKRQPVLVAFGSDGFYREEIAHVKREGLEGCIRFLPFRPNIAATLKGLDALVMPSLREACGLLAMEAMVAGVPVIGSDCIGLREVLKHTVATVVPARDSSALAIAIVSAMDEAQRFRAEAFAQEAARRFDVRKRVPDLERLMLDTMRLRASRTVYSFR